MPKVHVTSQIEIDVDDMLQGVAGLNTIELDRFTEQVIALRAQRHASHLPKDEVELLRRINQGMPPDVRARLAELNTKLFDDTITPVERAELLELTDEIELADAERLENLIRLAQLRGVSVDVLMAQLGIGTTGHA